MMMILEAQTRVFVDADALDATCAFYAALLGGKQTMRFLYPEMGLGWRRFPRRSFRS
jgi:hypothetical protein